MDRLIYVAMNGAKHTMHQQAQVAHNLANAATTGYKSEANAFRALPVVGMVRRPVPSWWIRQRARTCRRARFRPPIGIWMWRCRARGGSQCRGRMAAKLIPATAAC